MEVAMIGRIVPRTVMVLHGPIHLIGFAVYSRLAETEGIPYRTDLFSGNLNVEGFRA